MKILLSDYYKKFGCMIAIVYLYAVYRPFSLAGEEKLETKIRVKEEKRFLFTTQLLLWR